MYCTQCGSTLSPNGKFCIQCGAPSTQEQAIGLHTPPARVVNKESRRMISVALSVLTFLFVATALGRLIGMDGLMKVGDSAMFGSSGGDAYLLFRWNTYVPVSYIKSFVMPLVLVSLMGFLLGAFFLWRKEAGSRALTVFSCIIGIVSSFLIIVMSLIWNMGQSYTFSDLLVYGIICLPLSIAGLVISSRAVGLVEFTPVSDRKEGSGIMTVLALFGALGLVFSAYHFFSLFFSGNFLGSVSLSAVDITFSALRSLVFPIAAAMLFCCIVTSLLLRHRTSYPFVALICAGIGAAFGIVFAVAAFAESGRYMTELSGEIMGHFSGMRIPLAVCYALLHILLGLIVSAAICGRLNASGAVIIGALFPILLVGFVCLFVLVLDLGSIGMVFSPMIALTLLIGTVLLIGRVTNRPLALEQE